MMWGHAQAFQGCAMLGRKVLLIRQAQPLQLDQLIERLLHAAGTVAQRLHTLVVSINRTLGILPLHLKCPLPIEQGLVVSGAA